MFDDFKKFEWLTSEVNQHAGDFTKAIIAITLSNFLQIFTTLFVMVVYNKVIPNEAMTTLTSLFIGIAVILIFDLLFNLFCACLRKYVERPFLKFFSSINITPI